MPPQQVYVVVHDKLNQGEPPLQKPGKIAIALDNKATFSELSRKLSERFGRENENVEFELQVGDGFEVLLTDTIDSLALDEVVTAVRKPVPSSEIRTPSVSESTVASNMIVNAPFKPPAGNMQFSFVDAGIARKFAAENVRNNSEIQTGVKGFNGGSVSPDTNLNQLQQAAALALGWETGNQTEVEMVHKFHGCSLNRTLSCTCRVADSIIANGTLSTLHCRFQVDGSPCSDPNCVYSHSPVDMKGHPSTAPHCSVCEEALGLPCPKCLVEAVDLGEATSSDVYCPLIQNAGCGHLHHAHCVNRHSGLINRRSCPSGCPIGKYPAESVDFLNPQPHLLIAWDGDRLDRVSVSAKQDSTGHVTMPINDVLQIVQNFLRSQNFALPGLSVKISRRDPFTETVRFVNSTLVSVCPSSSHFYADHHRKPLFPELQVPQSPANSAKYLVDLHTSQGTITACGCTRVGDLFGPDIFNPIVMYAVKRKNNVSSTPAATGKRLSTSKEASYLLHDSWQPNVEQTPRGMAVLLSSLQVLAHSVSLKGPAMENAVLSLLFSMTRFPPAVRTLTLLFKNKTLCSEERAALSEALYCSLVNFLPPVPLGPAAIINNRGRSFEAVRIFLGYIVSSAIIVAKPSTVSLTREISTLCNASHKRLSDPVIFRGQVVERSTMALLLPRGQLYKPREAHAQPDRSDEPLEHIVKQAILHSRGITDASVHVLLVGNIDIFPSAVPLAYACRSFERSIRQANETDLITRGPLELKSATVVPPQIVLDHDGLLAVFTGRGCGSTRDVNFFRPICGGDEEVDINDVAVALQKVIPTRQAEGTWALDSFGHVAAITTRPPDEAIVICFDVSNSMNSASGVGSNEWKDRATTTRARDQSIADSVVLVEDLVKMHDAATILREAKAFITKLDTCSLMAWKNAKETPSVTASYYGGYNWDVCGSVIEELKTMTRREILEMSWKIPPLMPRLEEEMLSRAFFVVACMRQNAAVVAYFSEFLDTLRQIEVEGDEPFDVPRKFLDPKTGDLLQDPVRPTNAPKSVYVNHSSLRWFENGEWPRGDFLVQQETPTQLQGLILGWVMGADIIHPENTTIVGKNVARASGAETTRKPLNTNTDKILVKFSDGDKVVTWSLSKFLPTRTLYRLVNRFTRAQYASFRLRVTSSQRLIDDSNTGPLELVDHLQSGDTIELCSFSRHSRATFSVAIQYDYKMEASFIRRILLPQNATFQSVLTLAVPDGFNTLSRGELWNAVRSTGDGFFRGFRFESAFHYRRLIDYFEIGPQIRLVCLPKPLHQNPKDKENEATKHLTRLQLMKELFTVFVNRASAFDSGVSLVLGLVTFSDTTSVAQELSPIFGHFSNALDRIQATGDTQVYNALEVARSQLVNYRKDLPNLRRRIIIVTDGEDTKSTVTALEVCAALQSNKIVVDSVQVGSAVDDTLHAISVATGGYRFAPQTSLADALSIFDLETVLSSADRSRRAPMPLVKFISTLGSAGYGDTLRYPIDVVTVDRFPKRKEHEKLNKVVKNASSATGNNQMKDDRTRRIMRELMTLVRDPHPSIDIYVDDADMSFFKIILEAPSEPSSTCPYRGGCFLLTCDFPDTYPRDPPMIRFVTFILHPNISKQGKVCIAELSRLWSSDITLTQIFSMLYGLLLEPDLDNPLEVQASLKYYEDDGTYALAAANATQAHASKTRAEWRVEFEASENED